MRRAEKGEGKIGGHPRTPGHGTPSPGTPFGRRYAAGREKGGEEAGDIPAFPGQGAPPPEELLPTNKIVMLRPDFSRDLAVLHLDG